MKNPSLIDSLSLMLTLSRIVKERGIKAAVKAADKFLCEEGDNPFDILVALIYAVERSDD